MLKNLKAIVSNLAVAFFFSIFLIFLTFILFGSTINRYFNLINKFTTASSLSNRDDIHISLTKIEDKVRLSDYPYFGEVFGSVAIPSVGIDLTLYHGDTLDVIKYGAGHLAGSYFPGEGGLIVIDAHNNAGYFKELPNVKIGDNVVIKTSYGVFNYRIYNTVVKEASVLGSELNVFDDHEELMLYTCYPTDTPGFKSKRFVAYATRVGDSNE